MNYVLISFLKFFEIEIKINFGLAKYLINAKSFKKSQNA